MKTRKSRRVWGLAVAAGVMVAAAAASAAVAYLSADLGGGVTAADDHARGSLATGSMTRHGAEYLTYCATPGGQFATLVWLRNDGPVAVVLEGADPGPGGSVSDTVNTNGFSLTDLAVADSGGRTDPLAAPGLPPTELAPGQSVMTWARFVEGPHVDQSPSLIRSTTQVWVRITVLGMSRVVRVALGSPGIAVTGACPSAERH